MNPYQRKNKEALEKELADRKLASPASLNNMLNIWFIENYLQYDDRAKWYDEWCEGIE